jgi:uroporphyrinogen-III synthase
MPVIQPLLAIQPLPQPEPDLAPFTALVFTSRNGVAAFSALTSRRDRRVFTVGGATAEAARAAGFADVLSADGAIGDLAALLLAHLGSDDRVLAAVAARPVADLGALLVGRIAVERLAVYDAVDTGAAAPEGIDAVLIHSPRAAQAFAALKPTEAANWTVVAISAQAAAPLKALGIADLRLAPHPSDEPMLETLGKPAPDV